MKTCSVSVACLNQVIDQKNVQKCIKQHLFLKGPNKWYNYKWKMCFWLDNVTVFFFFLHFINKYKKKQCYNTFFNCTGLQGNCPSRHFNYHSFDTSQYDGLRFIAGSLTPIETFIFLVCMSYDRLNVSYCSADHLWCLFIMDLHYCNEWTCMGIKVTKIICKTLMNLSSWCNLSSSTYQVKYDEERKIHTTNQSVFLFICSTCFFCFCIF